MNRRFLPRQMMGPMVVLCLMLGCAGSSGVTPAPQSIPTLGPASGPSLQPGPGHAPGATSPPKTATPDPCIGWDCTLEGVVYLETAAAGNEAAGILIELSQVSYCSPTRGEHTITTGPDGAFGFPVFVHDTDTFWFQVEQAGYEPVRRSVGGFDCLYCVCPDIEIVLEPLRTSTSTP